MTATSPDRLLNFLSFPIVALLLSPYFLGQTAPTPAPETQATPASGPPRISRIEPPNWWSSFTPEVMLLVTGENLQGSSVLVNHVGVKVTRTEPQLNGDYLFVWLQLAPTIKPGKIVLNIRARGGNIISSYPLLGRSRAQPLGTNRNDVVYLIVNDRFADGDTKNNQPPRSMGVYDRKDPKSYHGGDLKGIRDHLSYLHDLGVTSLWLTPIWKNSDSSYHGYQPVDFYAVDEHMGTMLDYQELVRDAHRLGMKVLIDYGANHTGPKHPWVKDPPDATWFHGSPEKHLDASSDFASLTDPHATPRQYRQVVEGWFANELPDLNSDDPMVEQYLAENALWWAQTAALDGFRLDSFPHASMKFWNSWHKDVRKPYPTLTSIAEVSAIAPAIDAYFEGPQSGCMDSGATTLFDYPLAAVLRDVILRSESVQQLIDVLREDSLYARPDSLVTFFGNHEQPRFMGEVGSSKEKLKLAFSLLCTLRGIPQIYYGDEIGMLGGGDPDNRRDFPGGFSADTRSAFTAQGRTADEKEVFTHVQSLLHLREAHPALRSGHQWHVSWDGTFYAFVRQTTDERLLVLFNNSPAARDMTLSLHDTPIENAVKLQPVFGTAEALVSVESVHTVMPPMSVTVYAVK